MGVGQHPAHTVGDEFGRDRESDYLYGSVSFAAAWPCIPYGAVIVRSVDESKDGYW